MRSLAFLLALVAALLLPVSSAVADPDWTWPVGGPVLTQFLNGDNPYASGQHRGIDIGADVGTPVVAATSGTIVYAGVVGSSGVTVAERTDEYELSYLHLSSVAVRSGEHVDAGERVGAVGVTGTRSAAQPHLHFGVRRAGDRHAYLDPLRFLAPAPRPEPGPQSAPVPVREPVAAPAPVVVGPVPVAPPITAPVAATVRSLAPVPHGVATPHAPASAHHAPVESPRSAIAASRHPAARTAQPHAAPAHPAARLQPARGPAPRLAAAQASSAAPAGDPHRAHRGGGVDFGWLAACAGLVLAAATLARPGSRGRKRPPARAALTLLLRAAATPARARARQ